MSQNQRDRIEELIKPNGMIQLDSGFGKELGFTSDKFNGYLWHDRGIIWISFIESIHQGKGNLRTLFDTIESKGYKIVVPTPFARMQMICERRGMVKELLVSSEKDFISCMVRPESIKYLSTQ